MDDNETSWEALNSILVSDYRSFFYQASTSKWLESDTDHLLQMTKPRFHATAVPQRHILAFWMQGVQLQVDRFKSERNERRGFSTSKSHEGLYTLCKTKG